MRKNKAQLRPGTTWTEDESLNAVLARLGFTTKSNKLANYRKRIMLNNRQMFEGHAGQVWGWLKAGCPVNSRVAEMHNQKGTPQP